MEKSEKILILEEKLSFLKSIKKEKIKEITNIETELNWIKIQLEELTKKRY